MIIKEELEKILSKNWTQFIETKPLFLKTMKILTSHTLPIVKKSEIPQKKSVQISLSHVSLLPIGVKVWIEFLIPREEDTIDVGTLEAIITWGGEFTEQYVIGNRFILSS